MTCKLRIKMGNVEFEYEGDTEFTQGDIKDLFSHIEAVVPIAGASADAKSTSIARPAPPNGETAARTLPQLHTRTIAARLEVALAAAAHLQLIVQKETFCRKELLADMKTAAGHYKASMSNNIGNIVTKLINSRKLHQVGADAFALSAEALRT